MSNQYIRVPALMDEQPTNFYPYLAKLIGVNEAIVLQQIWFLINSKRNMKKAYHYRFEKWWVYNSYQQWCDEFFVWLKPRGLQGIILNLESMGVLVSMQGVPNKHDRRKWYTVNHEALNKLIEADLGHSAENVPYSADDALSNAHSMNDVDVHEMYDEYTEIENSTEESTERTTLRAATQTRADTSPLENPDAYPIADEAEDDYHGVSKPSSRTPVKVHSVEGNENSPAKTIAKPSRTKTKDASIPHSADPLSPPKVNAAEVLATAMGLKPVGDDWKIFGVVSSKLTRAGIVPQEFKQYVEYWTQRSEKEHWTLTATALTGGVRMSEYVQWRSEHPMRDIKNQKPIPKEPDPSEYVSKDVARAYLDKLLPTLSAAYGVDASKGFDL